MIPIDGLIAVGAVGYPGYHQPGISYTYRKSNKKMGQTLSEPEVSKNTAYCQNSQFKIGSSSMQGWRINMEDSHTHILSLPDDPGTAFFAVYDGHGGANIAKYAGRHLHKLITKQEQYAAGDIEGAMKAAFLEIDDVMRSDEGLTNEQSGSTAVAVLVKDNVVYCANVGDSRAIASVKGTPQELSFDHKPYKPSEYRRITAAGGFVEYNRVNGHLALSRALGDYKFKKNARKPVEEQIVTAYPDVQIHKVEGDWEFLVLACDGIWDVRSNEEVVQFVRDNIADGLEPEEICEWLMMSCLAPDCDMAGIGCDNMTVIIVCLLNGSTYEEFQAKCALPADPSASRSDDTSTEKDDGEWFPDGGVNLFKFKHDYKTEEPQEEAEDNTEDNHEEEVEEEVSVKAQE